MYLNNNIPMFKSRRTIVTMSNSDKDEKCINITEVWNQWTILFRHIAVLQYNDFIFVLQEKTVRQLVYTDTDKSLNKPSQVNKLM